MSIVTLFTHDAADIVAGRLSHTCTACGESDWVLAPPSKQTTKHLRTTIQCRQCANNANLKHRLEKTMALLTPQERQLRTNTKKAANAQLARFDAESKRKLANLSSAITQAYSKVADALLWLDTAQEPTGSLSFAQYLELERLDVVKEQLVKDLAILKKHLEAKLQLQPLFLDNQKPSYKGEQRTAVYKELLNLAPPDILKEYI